jgi:hypothetical protein
MWIVSGRSFCNSPWNRPETITRTRCTRCAPCPPLSAAPAAASSSPEIHLMIFEPCTCLDHTLKYSAVVSDGSTVGSNFYSSNLERLADYAFSFEYTLYTCYTSPNFTQPGLVRYTIHITHYPCTHPNFTQPWLVRLYNTHAFNTFYINKT